MVAKPREETEAEHVEGHKHLSPRPVGTGHSFTGKRTSAGRPFCLAESWAGRRKSFSILFYVSKDVQTKINATYVEGRVCRVGLTQVTQICGIINQLTCSMKGRGGIYFGICKRKKGQGVKKKHLSLNTFW